jgi:oligopeptide transport system substrate-binding protein
MTHRNPIPQFFVCALAALIALTQLGSPGTAAHAAQTDRAQSQTKLKRFQDKEKTFSVSLDETWRAEKSADVGLIVAQTKYTAALFLYNVGPEGSEETTFDNLLTDFKKGLEASMGSGKQLARKRAKIGKRASIEYADTLISRNSASVVARAFLMTQGDNRLFGTAVTEQKNFKALEKALPTILETVEFNAVKDDVVTTEALNRKETLMLAGGRFEPEFVDPAKFGGSADSYTGMLFSGLVRLTPQLDVTPDLAEKWTISPDRRVYTFTLRSNVKFADGRPITANDVRYSWERSADPKLKSNTAATYMGDIDGFRDVLAGKAKSVRGLKVINPRTLQVTLDGAKPYFLAKITYPVAYVVDGRDVARDADAWTDRPNASGPYGLLRYTPDRTIVFERNPNYHAKAKIRYVQYRINPGGSALSQYQDGDIDITYLARADYAAISSPEHPQHNELVDVPSLCTTFLNFDPAQAPTDDIEVRRALALAIDWQALAKLNEIEFDTTQLSILPPTLPGHVERERTLQFDPTKAKAALARSKYAGNIPPIKLISAGTGNTESGFYTLLLKMWKDTLGVSVQIEYLDGETFYQEARKSDGNIMPYGWCADYPDPENFLDVLYHSDSLQNVAGINDADLDTLLERARVEADPAARLALYAEAEILLLDQVIAVPFPRVDGNMLVKPHVKNYVASGIGVQQTHLLEISGYRE